MLFRNDGQGEFARIAIDRGLSGCVSALMAQLDLSTVDLFFGDPSMNEVRAWR